MDCLGDYPPVRVGRLGFGRKLVRLYRRTNVLQLRRRRLLRGRPGLLRRPANRHDGGICRAGRRRSPASAEPKRPQKSDWLPLGVFALTQDGEASGAEPSLYMQLAISKQGMISGTLKNTLTGKVQSLEGMADKKSQRVAWGVVDQERPIMETGLSNLTQDTSPALIHFADGQTQQWLMVRIPGTETVGDRRRNLHRSAIPGA